jgi:hypothetical protein
MSYVTGRNLVHNAVFCLALLGVGTGVSHPLRAHACDPCSVMAASSSNRVAPGGFSLGVAQQFTSFGTVQREGREIENVGSQRLDSSITQMLVGVGLTKSWSLHANLPLINRRFRRIEEGELERGTEAGIGDVALIATYRRAGEAWDGGSYSFGISGGLKLPTGDSGQLNESHGQNHSDHDGDHQREMEVITPIHGGLDHDDGEGPDEDGPYSGVASAIHGHDLALGSGSIDFPIGVDFSVTNGRAFLHSALQYTFRTEGDYNYEYADDLLWDVGPGYYLHLEHDDSVSLKLVLSGEYKRKDLIDGAREGDTRLRSMFIGPALSAHFSGLHGELAWFIPVDIDNSGTQAVADYRIKASVSYVF